MGAKVDDILAPGLFVVELDATVLEVRHLMRSHRVQALPVVDAHDRPVGIVTSTDLLKTTRLSTAVHSIMTPDVVTVSGRASVALAARTMRKHRIHHIVVIQAGKAVGILSTFDLLQLLERPSPARARPSVKK